MCVLHRNPLVYRTDIFDLRKLQAKNVIHHTTVRKLLFALAAHTLQEAQHLLDCLVAATRRFVLSVSIKKSEVIFQPQVSSCYLPPVATINSIQLPVAETFCYLGSRVTYRNTLDDELTARVAKAGAAFSQLSKWLFGHQDPIISSSYPLFFAVCQWNLDTIQASHKEAKQFLHEVSSQDTKWYGILGFNVPLAGY